MKKYIGIDFHELLVPQDGWIVYKDRWWIVNKDGCAVFVKNYYHPQSSKNHDLARRLLSAYENDNGTGSAELRFLDTAYSPIEVR